MDSFLDSISFFHYLDLIIDKIIPLMIVSFFFNVVWLRNPHSKAEKTQFEIFNRVTREILVQVEKMEPQGSRF